MELKHREAETETPDRLYFNEQGSTQEAKCNNPCCFTETQMLRTPFDGCWTDVINETSVQFNNTFHE